MTTPTDHQPTTPLLWSIRRELWENRSIFIAPLVAAVVVLFGYSIRALTLPRRVRAAGLDPAALDADLVRPFGIVAGLVIMTACIVGVFYCLDALYGERRDRSILFWKSLPVSDLTTVLSKASVPLLVLPLVGFTVSVAAQLGMLFLSSAALTVGGVGAGTLWSRLPFVQMPLVMLYGLVVHALWHAPLYAWLLLLSGWARRAVFLWAVLPPLGIIALERIAFQSSYFGHWIRYRLAGAMGQAFAAKHDDCVMLLAHLTPLRFLATPGLWLGLIAAAVFLAAAARLRRYREPI